MLSKKRMYISIVPLLASVCLFLFIFLAHFTETVYAAPIIEAEPNDDSNTAQELTSIGYENYVIASVNPANDRDWYKFSASAGETYVVEIFEASISVNSGAGSNCQSGRVDEGLGLKIYNSSITLVASSCEPNDTLIGSGNVHNIVQFAAGSNEDIYIQVVPNNINVTGNYNLRVLHQYSNVDASWDTDYEPNNRLVRAAEIEVGRTNAITSTIEQRVATNATNSVDFDWYRFTAEANTAYVVELFNIDVNFNAAAGSRCVSGRVDEGIGLRIYDVTGTEIVSVCEPNDTLIGSGNVHNIAQFTPGIAGTYFIKVAPNENNRFGNYSLRVLPQYDNSSASWDANYEPNNRLVNAAPIQVGRENAITTKIEQRITTYSTNSVDFDWYRFTAEANTAYVVELFNIDVNFNAAAGSRCVSGRVDEGIGLRIYDVTGTEIVSVCEPNDTLIGSGNVHNIAQFTPGIAGTYFIKVAPNENNRFGNYSLRVLPQYDNSSASWDANYEPNNRLVNAAPIQVGRENAITTKIEQRITTYSTNSVDFDWYRFTAEANTAYVVELFNIDVNFNAAAGSRCVSGRVDEGIGLRIYDVTGTEIVSVCEPNDTLIGSGNVHNIAQFTPGIAGTYFIKVAPNENNRFGNYSLRVLPQYDNSSASWDANYEPNNRAVNAYLLQSATILDTQIEQRSSTYSTNFVDRDWYRINAVMGESYTIETFNVASNLETTSGGNCTGSTRIGLGIVVFDPTLSIRITEQCSENGDGSVHTYATFTADTNGSYFIWIIPNSSTAFGNYSLRIAGQQSKVYLPLISQ